MLYFTDQVLDIILFKNLDFCIEHFKTLLLQILSFIGDSTSHETFSEKSVKHFFIIPYKFYYFRIISLFAF